LVVALRVVVGAEVVPAVVPVDDLLGAVVAVVDGGPAVEVGDRFVVGEAVEGGLVPTGAGWPGPPVPPTGAGRTAR
jgi:hypothetical protein